MKMLYAVKLRFYIKGHVSYRVSKVFIIRRVAMSSSSRYSSAFNAVRSQESTNLYNTTVKKY